MKKILLYTTIIAALFCTSCNEPKEKPVDYFELFKALVEQELVPEFPQSLHEYKVSENKSQLIVRSTKCHQIKFVHNFTLEGDSLAEVEPEEGREELAYKIAQDYIKLKREFRFKSLTLLPDCRGEERLSLTFSKAKFFHYKDGIWKVGKPFKMN